MAQLDDEIRQLTKEIAEAEAMDLEATKVRQAENAQVRSRWVLRSDRGVRECVWRLGVRNTTTPTPNFDGPFRVLPLRSRAPVAHGCLQRRVAIATVIIP